ncbi:unnamed protein product, partial [Staurois parvus]
SLLAARFQRFSHAVPVTASHCCCLSIRPHSAMCHFQVSSHCWCVEFFDIGCWQITGPPYSCCQAPNLP